MDISGKWKGEIVYGKEYGAWENKVLYFELSLHQDDLKISGKAKDLKGYGVNKTEAYINGLFLGNRIDFIKRYEAFELLVDNDQIIVSNVKNAPSLCYTGFLDTDKMIFNGTWEYKPAISTLPSGKTIQFEKATGTWSMKKLS